MRVGPVSSLPAGLKMKATMEPPYHSSDPVEWLVYGNAREEAGLSIEWPIAVAKGLEIMGPHVLVLHRPLAGWNLSGREIHYWDPRTSLRWPADILSRRPNYRLGWNSWTWGCHHAGVCMDSWSSTPENFPRLNDTSVGRAAIRGFFGIAYQKGRRLRPAPFKLLSE